MLTPRFHPDSSFNFCSRVSGPLPETIAEDDDEGAELEEEELESVQLSEKEFNILDFIKRWATDQSFFFTLSLRLPSICLKKTPNKTLFCEHQEYSSSLLE